MYYLRNNGIQNDKENKPFDFISTRDCNRTKKKSVFDNSVSLQLSTNQSILYSRRSMKLPANLLITIRLIEDKHPGINVCD